MVMSWEPTNVICPFCKGESVFRRKTGEKPNKYDCYIPNYKCFYCYTYFAEVTLKEMEIKDGRNKRD